MKRAIVVGGTSGIGRVVAEQLAARGDEVVITGRDAGRAEAIAAELGGSMRGLALDLAQPAGIASQLADLDTGRLRCDRRRRT